MDEALVRKHAQEHSGAIIEGDLRRAGADLTPEAQKQAPAVMKRLPRPVTSADIAAVAMSGGRAVARVRYGGEGAETVVESTWEERDGRPMIVELNVV